MNKEDHFAKSRIAIVGLGLMGGSLAMALRGRCRRLLGIDRNQETLELAMERGIVDAVHVDPGALLPQADIIVLALPVSGILDMIHRLPEFHPGPAVVMDLGSTKVEILRAMAQLPPAFDPVGGHPMCGKETSGLENADPAMYRGSPFALTSLDRTSLEARGIAEALVQAAGAVPIWLEPETHDSWVASTSHLPYLLSVALTGATPEEAAALVGPGFRGTSRLAGSSPEVMADILVTNRGKVLEALEQFWIKLGEIESFVLRGDRDHLITQLEKTRRRYERLTKEEAGREA